MPFWDKIVGVIGGPITGFVDAIFGGIDSLSTTDEEKFAAKQKILEARLAFELALQQSMDKVVSEQASIIRAEATGESWLQRNWRPLTMLAFLVILFLYWFGVEPDGLTQETINAVFRLLQLGIGGYIVGRSVEKGLHTWKNGNGK
jgi:hypothetical protein